MNTLEVLPGMVRNASSAIVFAVWRASYEAGLTALVIWAVCRAFPRLTPSVRCWLWRAVLVKFVLTLVWHGAVALPILPTHPNRVVAGNIVRSPFIPEQAAVNAPVAKAKQDMAASTPPHRRDAPNRVTEIGAPELATTGTLPAPAAEPPTHVVRFTPPPRGARFAAGSAGSTFLAALFAAWLVGVAACLLRLVRRALQTRHFLSTACRPIVDDPQTTRDASSLCYRLGLDRVPRLLTAPGLAASQLVAGWSVRILMPDGGDAEARRLMLAHELAHVRRRDLCWSAFSVLVHVLFFFHPLVWMARREEELACEMACDALVLTTTTATPAAYGALLVEAAAQQRGARWNAYGAATSLGIAQETIHIKRRLIALQSVYSPLRRRQFRVLLAASSIAAIFAIVPWHVVAAASHGDGNVKMPPLTGSPADGTAVLEGRVVYAASGLPVASAWVTAASGVSDTDKRHFHPSAQVCSDFDGRYRITGLAPGIYQVTATIRFGEDGRWLSPPVRPVLITKESKHSTTTRDVSLVRGVRVIGTVTDAVTGAPMVNAAVSGTSIDSGPETQVNSAMTDAYGHYRLDVLPGKAIVSLHPEPLNDPRNPFIGRFETPRIQTRWFPQPTSGNSSPDRFLALRLIAQSGSALAANFSAPTVPLPGTAAIPGEPSPIIGRVTGSHGEPAAGAEVVIRNIQMTDLTGAWDDNPRVVRTGGLGQFQFDGLPRQWAGMRCEVRARSFDGWQAKTIHLTIPKQGPEPPLALPLNVRTATVRGRIVNAAGQPIGGAIVTVRQTWFDPGFGYISDMDTVISDASGRYQFANVWSDLPLSFKAQAAGYHTLEAPTHANITITPGQALEYRDIRLPAANGSVAGVLVSASGRPVAGINVGATDDVVDTSRFHSGSYDHTGRTDAKGRFRIDGLPEGNVWIRVTPFEVEMRGLNAPEATLQRTGDTQLRIVLK